MNFVGLSCRALTEFGRERDIFEKFEKFERKTCRHSNNNLHGIVKLDWCLVLHTIYVYSLNSSMMFHVSCFHCNG